MTNLSVDIAGRRSSAPDRTGRGAIHAPANLLPLWFMIAVALALSLVLSHTRALAVWHSGTFYDPDDAMRLVEVRDLLRGQGWFDMTQYRLDPPAGVFMHWSHVIDLPQAMLIKMFGLFMPQDLAERAMRLAFPMSMLALLYLGVARLAQTLIGGSAVMPALALTLLSGMAVGQFQPGRIHQTGPQIMLTIFMLASFVEAIDEKKARRAAITGLLGALSLAIGVETLPFILLLAALAGALWIALGAKLARMLTAFGLGLAIGLPLAYVATIGPARWFATVCDAYSPVYFVPGIVGALGLAGLGLASERLATRSARAIAGIGVAGLTLAAASAIKPVCFIDPYHGIDPLVREIWLNNVIEGFSLPRLFAGRIGLALVLILPTTLGIGGLFAALVQTTGTARLRWFVVTLMSLAAAGLSVWMIRMTSYAVLTALLGGLWCICTLREALMRTRWREIASLAFALTLPFSSVGWALAIPTKPDVADWRHGSGCLVSNAFTPLAQLPPGLVAAPIDAGAHLLALTGLNVLAAPYHRNNDGNRAMFDAMLAPQRQAHDILVTHHVTYVMTCNSLTETRMLAARAPYSLAADLLANRPPDWLKRVPNAGPYHVFVIQP